MRLRVYSASRGSRPLGVRRGIVVTRTRLRRVRWQDATRWKEHGPVMGDREDRLLCLLINAG